MNTRGLMELIVLNIGLELRVLSPTLFAMLVADGDGDDVRDHADSALHHARLQNLRAAGGAERTRTTGDDRGRHLGAGVESGWGSSRS